MQELSIFLPGILLSYFAFILGVLSPGPNVLAVMGTSMDVNRKSGIAMALGIAIGSLTWATLSVLGVTVILSSYVWAMYLIKLFGGGYLLWLAYKAFKSAASKHHIHAQQISNRQKSMLGYAFKGYLIMMTNPKAVLAWIAIVSLGLQPGAPNWVAVAIVLGTFIISIVAHVLYAVAFSTTTMVKMYSKARRYIQATLGTFFAFAGLKLLTSKN